MKGQQGGEGQGGPIPLLVKKCTQGGDGRRSWLTGLSRSNSNGNFDDPDGLV